MDSTRIPGNLFAIPSSAQEALIDENHIENSSQHIQRLDALIRERDIKINNLEEQLASSLDLKERNDNLTTKLTTAVNFIKQLKDQNSQLKQQQDQNHACSAKNASGFSEIHDEEISALMNQVSTLQEQLLSSQNELLKEKEFNCKIESEYKEKLQNSLELHSQALNNAKLLEDLNKDLRAQNDKLNENLSNSLGNQSENSEKEEIVYLKKQLASMTNEIESLKSDFFSKQEQLSSQLKQTRQAAASKIKEIKSENEDLKFKLMSLNSDDEQRTLEVIYHVNDQMNESSERNGYSQDQEEILRRQEILLSENEALKAQLNNKLILEETVFELEEKFKNISSEYQDLKSEYSSSKTKFNYQIQEFDSKFKQETENLMIQINELETDRDEKIETISKLMNEHKKFLDEKQQSSNSTLVDSLKDEIVSLNKLTDEYKDKISAMEDVKLQLQKEAQKSYDNSRKEVEALKEKYENEIKNLNSELMTKSCIASELSSNISNMTSQIQVLDERISSKDAEIARLNKTLEELENYKNQHSNQDIIGFKPQTIEIQSVLQTILNEDNDISKLNTEISNLDPEIGQPLLKIQSCVEKLRSEKKLVENALNEEIDLLENEVKEMNNQIQKLKENSKRDEENASKLKLEIDRLENEKLEIMQNGSIKALKERVKELESSLSEQKSLALNLSEENVQLETERSNISDKLNYFKEFIGPKLKSEIETNGILKEKIIVVERERNELQSTISQLEEHYKHQLSNNAIDDATAKKLEDLTRENSKNLQELERLRQFLIENEEIQNRESLNLQSIIEEKTHQILLLENTRDELQSAVSEEQKIRSEVALQYQQAKFDLNEACAESHRLKTKLQQESNTLKNLQKVLEQFQTSKF